MLNSLSKNVLSVRGYTGSKYQYIPSDQLFIYCISYSMYIENLYGLPNPTVFFGGGRVALNNFSHVHVHYIGVYKVSYIPSHWEGGLSRRQSSRKENQLGKMKRECDVEKYYRSHFGLLWH